MPFPNNFIWGAATASFQIEGGAWEDGRGESIWDRFCRKPGAVLNGDTGDVACDHYHKYKEDVALMKDLGIGAYRYSVAWPRILPEGSGKVNPAGIDFYRRLNDELLSAGIRPFVTLFHWDLPQALDDKGGWLSRETALRFGDYAEVVVSALKDQVKDWFTLNEPWCSSVLSYDIPWLAPGRKEPPSVVAQSIHNLLLAHGHGVRAVRANGGDGAEVGIVLNLLNKLPATDSPEDLAAAEAAYALENDWWLDPLYKASYPEGTWLNREGARPEIESGDMELIASPTDFLGLNLYSADLVSAEAGAFPIGPEEEVTGMGWRVLPESIYEGIRRACKYPVKKLYITENGAAYPDVIADDGMVHDPERVSFLKRYLAQVERAVDDGYPLEGYFAWSLMDNFEWSFGYSRRFGLIYIDYDNDTRRIPKDSYHFYKELVTRADR